MYHVPYLLMEPEDIAEADRIIDHNGKIVSECLEYAHVVGAKGFRPGLSGGIKSFMFSGTIPEGFKGVKKNIKMPKNYLEAIPDRKTDRGKEIGKYIGQKNATKWKKLTIDSFVRSFGHPGSVMDGDRMGWPILMRVTKPKKIVILQLPWTEVPEEVNRLTEITIGSFRKIIREHEDIAKSAASMVR